MCSKVVFVSVKYGLLAGALLRMIRLRNWEAAGRRMIIREERFLLTNFRIF